MATPTLTPSSQTSAVRLPATGTTEQIADGSSNILHYPIGVYAGSDQSLFDASFITGAADQVSYVYKKLGGDVLDIELTVGNVYAALHGMIICNKEFVETKKLYNTIKTLMS